MNHSSPDINQLLSADEIAALGGPSKRTLERLRQEGGGPPYVRWGQKLIRYRAIDYRAWLEANCFKHAAEERIFVSKLGQRG
jgi:predicted DNA-binding transcriptional regulator AlpA